MKNVATHLFFTAFIGIIRRILTENLTGTANYNIIHDNL